MSDDNQRQEETISAELSRHAATSEDSDYSLSIEDALALYEAADLPRTMRSIQRYCAKRHLDAHRMETPFGEKFLITPASVERHIAYVKEVRPVATSRDLSRHAAAGVARENQDEVGVEVGATSGDHPRQAATGEEASRPVAPKPEATPHLVAVDSRINELLERENEFLRGQIAMKDHQIEALNDRVFETNSLTAGLQKLLTPLLGRAEAPKTRTIEDAAD